MSLPDHDDVVRFVAANRFPFPGQKTWPAEYVTLTNVSDKKRAVPTPQGDYYPDIVVVDAAGKTREIGDVEETIDLAKIEQWRAASAAGDELPDYGTRIFFLYVPEGKETEAQKVLDDNAIPYAGVRGYRQSPTGEISIVPFVTRGNPYDHQ
ncbi:hypothetical protein [Devosia naphthalenivorans]|jgi:hypothetical protein|uniref:hypothetical protein n=1 Tax=Devosia naphthalenivorans TaxID=2082392 RepID=UPI000D3509EA|nr:hypothetical protein [Devosia naphthalenivorans]